MQRIGPEERTFGAGKMQSKTCTVRMLLTNAQPASHHKASTGNTIIYAAAHLTANCRHTSAATAIMLDMDTDDGILNSKFEFFAVIEI